MSNHSITQGFFFLFQDWCILLQHKILQASFRDLITNGQECALKPVHEDLRTEKGKTKSHPYLSLHRHKICRPTAQTCHSRICAWTPATGFSRHLHRQKTKAKCWLNETHLLGHITSGGEVWRPGVHMSFPTYNIQLYCRSNLHMQT